MTKTVYLRSSRWLQKEELRIYIGGWFAPLANSTLYDWMKKKGFPQPLRPLGLAPVWDRYAVDEWILSFASDKPNKSQVAKDKLKA